MKYSTFDAFAQEMNNQNYDLPQGYVCPDCETENDIAAEVCDGCGEQILFSGNELSECFEPDETPAKTVDLSEPPF